MSDTIDAIVLGLIQGLTEFLPVSSDGHLELGRVVFGMSTEDNFLLNMVLHFATALSTIIVFRGNIWKLLKGLIAFKWNSEWRYGIKIVIAVIPIGILGFLFDDYVEALFGGKILLTGFMLWLTAAFLIVAERLKPVSTEYKEVNYWQAFLIGCAQTIAIFPGLSRSGCTIATALALGVGKREATAFSFLIVLPPILGGVPIKVYKYWSQNGSAALSSAMSWQDMTIGALVAFLVGLLACSGMVRIVQNGRLYGFAVYCIVLGAAAIFWALK